MQCCVVRSAEELISELDEESIWESLDLDFELESEFAEVRKVEFDV
jgi:hypothetical protein